MAESQQRELAGERCQPPPQHFLLRLEVCTHLRDSFKTPEALRMEGFCPFCLILKRGEAAQKGPEHRHSGLTELGPSWTLRPSCPSGPCSGAGLLRHEGRLHVWAELGFLPGFQPRIWPSAMGSVLGPCLPGYLQETGCFDGFTCLQPQPTFQEAQSGPGGHF